MDKCEDGSGRWTNGQTDSHYLTVSIALWRKKSMSTVQLKPPALRSQTAHRNGQRLTRQTDMKDKIGEESLQSVRKRGHHAKHHGQHTNRNPQFEPMHIADASQGKIESPSKA